MSTTSVHAATSRSAMQPTDGRDAPARSVDTLTERLASQRRDSLRSDESARERHRADFERALRRAGADADDETRTVCAPVAEPTAMDDRRATATPPSDTLPSGRERRANAVDSTDRATPPECVAAPSVHVAAAMLEPASRPSPSPHAPPDAAPGPRALALAADAAGRWRFELADTSLPIRQLDVQRLPHGALEVSLPALRSANALLGEPLMRLRERLVEHGVTLASSDPRGAETGHAEPASNGDTLARHPPFDRLPAR